MLKLVLGSMLAKRFLRGFPFGFVPPSFMPVPPGNCAGVHSIIFEYSKAMQKNKCVRREDLRGFGLGKALGHVDADFGNGAALALDVVRNGLFEDSFDGFASASAELVAKSS
jgi:hypothetical protein